MIKTLDFNQRLMLSCSGSLKDCCHHFIGKELLTHLFFPNFLDILLVVSAHFGLSYLQWFASRCNTCLNFASLERCLSRFCLYLGNWWKLLQSYHGLCFCMGSWKLDAASSLDCTIYTSCSDYSCSSWRLDEDGVGKLVATCLCSIRFCTQVHEWSYSFSCMSFTSKAGFDYHFIHIQH